MGLGNWLARKKPPAVWAVKQLDDGLMHLCGQGIIEGKGSATAKLKCIQAGQYSGPVRMRENGAVINSGQFAQLIPAQDLVLMNDREAQWQGRRWQVAWVPQRCWVHVGRLIAQPADFQGESRLISVESTDDILTKAKGTPRHSGPSLTLETIEPPGHWRQSAKNNHGTEG